MTQEPGRATAFELLDAVFKSWWTVVAGLCLGLVGSLVALHFIPKVYAASTKVRVAPQSIPEDMLASTVTDDMSRRLIEVQEAILTRANMQELIRRNFDVPKDHAAEDGMIRWLRSRVQVVNPRNTRLVLLTYYDNVARRSADVVNTLTELYVEQNQEYRSSQAESTRLEFEAKAEEAKAELDEVEAALREMRARHFQETEAALGVNVQRLETRRRDLEANRANQLFTRQKLEDLQRQRAQGNWTVAPETVVDGETIPPEQVRVAQLEREIEDLLIVYSESHPDVIRKRRELEELKARVTPAPEGGDPVAAVVPRDPRLAALERQIHATEQELARLRQQESGLQGEIREIERKIARTPEIQTRMSELEERRRVLDERYKDMKAKAERARNSEFLEETGRGQRLEVIEWAVVPFRPVSPEPLRVYAVGVVLGLLLLVGPLVLRHLLNPVVSSEAGMRSFLEVPVLVSIPRVITRDNHNVGRRRFVKNFGLSIVSAAVLIAAFVVLG